MTAARNASASAKPARRERLLNAPALVIMSASVLLALWILFPRQPAFRDPANLNAKDALSIAYLRVLVQADPGNDPLRLTFVKLLTEAGEDAEAVEALARLKANPPARLRFEVGLADVRLSLQRLYRRNLDEPATAALNADISAAFQSLLPLAANPEERKALAVEAERFGAPKVMALLTEQLAGRAQTPTEQAHWWSEAARHRLANGEALIAAQHHRLAFRLRKETPATRAPSALAALQAYLAAGALADGLATARETVAALPEDEALLTLAIDVAEQAGDQPLAYRWMQRLQRRNPEDVPLAERSLRKAVSLSRLDDALQLARRLVGEKDAGAAARQVLLAKVFDWNAAYPEALALWFPLAMSASSAQNNPDRDEAEARSFAIAKALADDERLLQLVETLMDRRALQDAEIDAYRVAGLRSGEPRRLTAALERYLEQHPGRSGAAWRALAAIRSAEGDAEQAVAAWENTARSQPLSGREWLQLAEALRQSGETAAALERVLALKIEDEWAESYWHLRADLAWSLERDDLAREASETVLRQFDARDREAIDRLLSLARQAGDGTALNRWARYGWEMTGDRDHLILLMERARARGDWAQLNSLLDEAARKEAVFASHPQFWQYRAERAQRAGEHAEALVALKRMLAGRAYDTEALEAYLWALLAAEPLPRAELVQMTEQFGPLARASAGLSQAFAATWLSLGNAQAALPLFRQSLVQGRPGDPIWRLLTADSLEWLGCTASANRLRYDTLEQMRKQKSLLSAETTPRLATLFFGGEDPAPAAAAAQAWQLAEGARDNARQFALRWLDKRLQLDAWQAWLTAWREGRTPELDKILDELHARLLSDPAGDAAKGLPLTLNEVAGESERGWFSSRRKAQRGSTVPDAAECLAVLADLQIAPLKPKPIPVLTPLLEKVLPGKKEG